ncbi:MAG: MBL fold metallo-hydrolase [Acidobacteria bacterium]|nr:MBL fold metallo-hydrolase [Acidobacteriota bacterium]
MAVRFTVLASGSKGNCTVVGTERTRLLVDCGLSCRETFRRMRQMGEQPESLSAIVVSHEHSDHVQGVLVTAKKLRIPMYMTAATRAAWRRQVRAERLEVPPDMRHESFEAGASFQIGDIAVSSFTIPHDAADPVGFTFRAEGVKMGIVTDLGYMPASVRHHVRGCDVLMIESNHDLEMLRTGPYPWAVKQRVMSRVGHLSNDSLAEFLAGEYDGGAALVILAHLSEQNNHPELARRSAETALGPRQTLMQNRLMLASQAQPLEPIML